MVTAAKKSEDDYFCQESYDKFRQCVEKQRHYSANKGPYSQGYGLPSGHVWLWELHRKGRMPKNWCLWTVVLEKAPESPLENKAIKPVNLKGDQPWIFTGRTDAEAQYFGHLIQLPTHWRSPWCWETLREKRASADEMARWYHWCNGHELGQTLGDGEGQEGLACCSPWDHKESDMTGRLDNSNNSF